jgi:hypothetical protein
VLQGVSRETEGVLHIVVFVDGDGNDGNDGNDGTDDDDGEEDDNNGCR